MEVKSGDYQGIDLWLKKMYSLKKKQSAIYSDNMKYEYK